ncbi:conjugal transfer protein TraD [Parashewanella spongiae]|uniref:Conjugal transfer protein TraD n=1 Tax=Parashewanella spongiae TaxID=342950 RepID=A0A3A6TPY2_9GAMM|nr:conjugal transfer protein TraD [Parashewanella spongiae]MCL1078423.1 conjugal transfer protein TraD [Parashewanella spongiae]RJY13304.1 conjugal transfer protein TraD [Parashewanella spongiae]
MTNNLSTNLDEKLFALNIPGNVVEVTTTEAEKLGAFEEDALTENEALDASQETSESEDEE